MVPLHYLAPSAITDKDRGEGTKATLDLVVPKKVIIKQATRKYQVLLLRNKSRLFVFSSKMMLTHCAMPILHLLQKRYTHLPLYDMK